jgi:hypothetical protein
MKVSLKKLKELRDEINEAFENCHSQAYITIYGKDIETRQDIFIEKRLNLYAERDDANWIYKLVIGFPRVNK